MTTDFLSDETDGSSGGCFDLALAGTRSILLVLHFLKLTLKSNYCKLQLQLPTHSLFASSSTLSRLRSSAPRCIVCCLDMCFSLDDSSRRGKIATRSSCDAPILRKASLVEVFTAVFVNSVKRAPAIPDTRKLASEGGGNRVYTSVSSANSVTVRIGSCANATRRGETTC